jgi:hypothetical protein
LGFFTQDANGARADSVQCQQFLLVSCQELFEARVAGGGERVSGPSPMPAAARRLIDRHLSNAALQ